MFEINVKKKVYVSMYYLQEGRRLFEWKDDQILTTC